MSTPASTPEAQEPDPALVPVSGWGRSRVMLAREVASEDLLAATDGATLTRGLGRSYGDASLPAREGRRVAASVRANRLVDFDAETGRLRAEAGFSLAELLRTFLPRGWFTPVTPGTRFVTFGGMVASDVHGKNHHRVGTFGRHVQSLRLRTGEGKLLRCSREEHPELFAATLGGMGLTGHILDVELQLERIPSPWIEQELEVLPDLHTLLERLRAAADDWPMTVSWVDAFARGRHFGRGVVVKGRWAEAAIAPREAPGELLRPTVPFELPSFALNPLTGRAFYEVYTRIQRAGRRVVHPEPFFYPLDAIRHWNRLYGRRGFTQYQCVLPDRDDAAPVQRCFELLQQLDATPFLSVVKDFGAEGEGLLSFPCPGITLSLDIPIDRERTQSVVDRLNELVLECGGRVYLSKDAFTRAEHFRAMEPRLAQWRQVREKWDPQQHLASALSVRLLGDEA
ncbi:MAG: FAD-binding oxidoreductase [Myxococcota bacterium]|nr:FAD-binding oxidoreductase [Myxococcota bacterium]